MNKEKFLKTELGSSMIECVKAWDHWLTESKRYAYDLMTNREYKSAKEAATRCQAQWKVYQMAVRQFMALSITSHGQMNTLAPAQKMKPIGCSK
ncbi:MAG: hypothetical protein KHZ73_00835 [Lachnospiraceae bacterium]|nr:hypothetical protein [Lachnospiraceae bacterium]